MVLIGLLSIAKNLCNSANTQPSASRFLQGVETLATSSLTVAGIYTAASSSIYSLYATVTAVFVTLRPLYSDEAPKELSAHLYYLL